MIENITDIIKSYIPSSVDDVIHTTFNNIIHYIEFIADFARNEFWSGHPLKSIIDNPDFIKTVHCVRICIQCYIYFIIIGVIAIFMIILFPCDDSKITYHRLHIMIPDLI